MNIPIVVKRGQRFFVEPKDKRPDLTFANARTTEMLHAKHQMDESLVGLPEGVPPPAPVPIKGVAHYFYEVTHVGGVELQKIHQLQMWNGLPVVLWHKMGERGLYKHYEPKKGTRGLPALMRKATSAAAKKKAVAKLIEGGVVVRASTLSK